VSNDGTLHPGLLRGLLSNAYSASLTEPWRPPLHRLDER
jgi:hypothetical protein